MTQFPESMLAVIKAATQRHGNDVAAAAAEAEAEVRKLPEYASLAELLVSAAVRDAVYAARHKINVAIKRDSWTGPAKVVVGLSTGVEQAMTSCFSYCIGGRLLGDLTGFDLPKIAQLSQSQADGHLFNVRLVQWLQANGVAEGRRVRDCVTESRLRQAFANLGKMAQSSDVG